MKKMRSLIVVGLFLLMGLGAYAVPSLYPMTLGMKLDSGHAVKTVTVYNTGGKVMKYKVSVNDLDNDGVKSDLAKYMKVFPKFMVIQPGESQVVKVIVKGVPAKEWAAGEHKGSIAVEEITSEVQQTYKTKLKKDEISTKINFKYVINMAIYGYVGELKPALKVTDLKVSNDKFTGTLKDIGNYSFYVKYLILDNQGKVVGHDTLYKILAGKTDKFEIKKPKNGVELKLLEKETGALLFRKS